MNEWKKQWRQFTFYVLCFKETFDDCCQLQLTRLNDSLGIRVSFYPFQGSCSPFISLWLQPADDEAVGESFLGSWQMCKVSTSLSFHHCLTEAWLERGEHRKYVNKTQQPPWALKPTGKLPVLLLFLNVIFRWYTIWKKVCEHIPLNVWLGH